MEAASETEAKIIRKEKKFIISIHTFTATIFVCICFSSFNIKTLI